MTLFVAAIDNLFADQYLAHDALLRSGGADPAVSIRAVVRRSDRIAGLGDVGIVAGTVLIDVRTAEASSLAEGDTLEVDGALYVVQGQPVRDSEQLLWTAEARRL